MVGDGALGTGGRNFTTAAMGARDAIAMAVPMVLVPVVAPMFVVVVVVVTAAMAVVAMFMVATMGKIMKEHQPDHVDE